MTGRVRYFAYGSNLCHTRMRARAPCAERISTAVLSGYGLGWSKRSVDGSGKCTIVARPDDPVGVHGVLYRVSRSGIRTLDRAEGLGIGYAEVLVTVETTSGPSPARTYIAMESHVDDELVPYAWYRELVVAGARAACLPDHYVRHLASVRVCEDPDPVRAARNRAVLPCDSSPARSVRPGPP